MESKSGRKAIRCAQCALRNTCGRTVSFHLRARGGGLISSSYLMYGCDRGVPKSGTDVS